MARQLNDVRLAVMMIDGIEHKGHTNVVAIRSKVGASFRTRSNTTQRADFELRTYSGHELSFQVCRSFEAC